MKNLWKNLFAFLFDRPEDSPLYSLAKRRITYYRVEGGFIFEIDEAGTLSIVRDPAIIKKILKKEIPVRTSTFALLYLKANRLNKR